MMIPWMSCVTVIVISTSLLGHCGLSSATDCDHRVFDLLCSHVRQEKDHYCATTTTECRVAATTK